jgi:acetylornithine deacetylase/succinyl-diaminopimelate desuccinylase-like protein
MAYSVSKNQGVFSSMESIHRHIDLAFNESLDILKRFLRIPAISATGVGVRECAGFLKKTMEESGISTTIVETPGSPVVYGELFSKNKDAKTVLFYGHYDVQPPEPLDLWESPPFEPVVREGRLFGRGVADNKGQMISHILAVQAFRATGTEIPVNLKFVFEGEEESGSPNLADFVRVHKELLACDVVLPVDGSLLPGNILNVRLGSRGVVNFEISLQTAAFDYHSGRAGGVIPNAGWELVRLLRTMKDEEGKILIEGFADDVRPPSDYDLSIIQNMPFDERVMSALHGVDSLGLDGNEYFTRLNLLPTLSINGITCGYQGEGSKTVIPSRASVKMDARLVVDQNPVDIIDKIKKHVAKHAPAAKVRIHGYMHPSKTDADLPVCRSVVSALEKVYTEGVILSLASGGSLPNYVWTDILRVPALCIPYANEDCKNHAPNENLDLELFKKGIHASACIMHDLT